MSRSCVQNVLDFPDDMFRLAYYWVLFSDSPGLHSRIVDAVDRMSSGVPINCVDTRVLPDTNLTAHSVATLVMSATGVSEYTLLAAVADPFVQILRVNWPAGEFLARHRSLPLVKMTFMGNPCAGAGYESMSGM